MSLEIIRVPFADDLLDRLAGQLWQLSLLLQVPSPQAGPVPQPPHWFLHSLTQMLSQRLLQQ